MDEHLEDLPPGARAEAALRDWWNLAGSKGGFRGVAVVSPKEELELGRLMTIARDALREARGTDLSPATGRAAAELRRARDVRVVVRDPDRETVRYDSIYPVTLEGELIRNLDAIRYNVTGRISNRSGSDAPRLLVSVLLRLDHKVIASREVVVRRIMARGEAPIRTTFELAPQELSEERLSLRVTVTPEVEAEPDAPEEG